jgi:endonuclease III
LTKKVKVGFLLDDVLVTKFRQFVAEQYGKVSKGLLSFEASQALQAWISTHKGTQTELMHKPPNPIPNVFTVKEQVKTYLRETFGYEQIYKVPKTHLIMALSSLRGTDERTIRKWMKLFEKYKVIKWVTPSVVEFL